MLSNFLKDDGTNIIFTGYCLEMYVPESYFDNRMAEIEGSLLNVFGLLPCAVLDSNQKVLLTDIFNIPTMIIIPFKDIIKEKKTLIESPYAETEPCRTIRFYKNDIITMNSVQRDVSNVEMFIRLLCNGKINMIPYNRIIDVWEKNLQLNGIKLGISSLVLELIVSEIYRNKNNPDEKFSKLIGKNPKVSQYMYRASNIREICSRNSTFAALSFEDMDSMITSSLNMNKYNKKQVESPIEKIIKF